MLNEFFESLVSLLIVNFKHCGCTYNEPAEKIPHKTDAIMHNTPAAILLSRNDLPIRGLGQKPTG
jgi:hypothetical protein